MITLEPPRTRARTIPWGLAAGVALVLVVIGPLVRGARFVPRLTVDNQTPYVLTIEATDAGHRGWTSVAIVNPKSVTSVDDVIDQGKTWVFHMSGQGADGGEYRATRDDLQRAGWRLTVPNDVTNRLRAAGAPPSPGF